MLEMGNQDQLIINKAVGGHEPRALPLTSVKGSCCVYQGEILPLLFFKLIGLALCLYFLKEKSS